MKTISILFLLALALSSTFAQLEPWNQGYEGQAYQQPFQQQPWLQVPPFQQQPWLQVTPIQQQPWLQVPPFQQQPWLQIQPFQQPGLQVQPFQQPGLQVQPFQQSGVQQPGLQVQPFQQPGLQVQQQPFQQPGLQVQPFQQPGLQQQPFQQPGLQVPPFLQPFQQLGIQVQSFQQVQPFQQVQQFQQQLNPCKVFFQQQCSPVTLPFTRSQSWQQSSCQVLRQQCCQLLAQIPQQYQYHAISSVVQAILQQQQQEGISFYQPHISPLQIINLGQNIPNMCNVHVLAYGKITPYTSLA